MTFYVFLNTYFKKNIKCTHFFKHHNIFLIKHKITNNKNKYIYNLLFTRYKRIQNECNHSSLISLEITLERFILQLASSVADVATFIYIQYICDANPTNLAIINSKNNCVQTAGHLFWKVDFSLICTSGWFSPPVYRQKQTA